METPKINNQPKIDLEKAPHQNEESLSTEEQESGKRENITLEIDGQTIEAVKYYFEYPKHIQEETGILGYERTVLNVETVSEEMCITILSKLSNEEYPKYSFNHQMNAYVDPNDSSNIENFVKDKFFVQKIHDIDLIKKEVENQKLKDAFGQVHTYKVFNHPAKNYDSPEQNTQSNISVFDKITGKRIHSSSHISIGELSKYSEQLEKDQVFACSADSGLNVSYGNFFSKAVGTPSFGFSPKDIFFKNYLHKSLKNYSELKDDKGENEVYNGVSGILRMMILDQEFTRDFTNSEDFKKLNASELKNTEMYQIFSRKAKDLLKTITGEQKIELPDVFSNEDQFDNYIYVLVYGLIDSTEKESSASDSTTQCNLPVFINHDEVPQLRWGYAKYGHLFTKKGLNFIEFKHADHLPKSTDSEN